MSSQVDYLLSLGAIQDRSKVVWQAAQTGNLSNFVFHEDRLGGVADFVTSIIKHFEVGNVPRIENALQQWKSSGCSDLEVTRRLVDLFFVLDAGAGDKWHYVEPQTERKYGRSEGIALASLHMLNELAFTASRSAPTVNDKCFQILLTKIDPRAWD